MSKYFGKVGYALPEESAPDVISYNNIIERPYYGDVIKATQKNDNGEGLNDDFNISEDISILADEFAYTHSHFIKYAILYGIKWKVKSISVNRPRITLTLGGVYNEQ